MKSPICEVCGKDFRSECFHTGKGGVLLNFADYEALPENAVGHPFGSGWFCERHAHDAESLIGMNFKDAIEKIREKYSIKESSLPTDYSNINDPELWVTNVGSNKSKVFSIIRKAMGISPAEAKLLLSSSSFKVMSGWPTEFASYKKQLENCGASVEIQYDT